ncbi:MAG TPA: hypothetical protein VGP48_06645 [Stellaceae bacterium]|jgi:hypothetical protein|nr:hypothetical protein [Stellaceae bacterium]
MHDDPFAGRGLRAPERSRMLVATDDGVFLWPGTALAYRRGEAFLVIEPREVNSAMGGFFGPAALDLPLQTILERARDELRNGRVAVVQEMLDRLLLPPVSPNGTQLMRAIAERQALSVPDYVATSAPSGTAWTSRDIDFFARLYDPICTQAHALAKVFNPTIGDPSAGWDPGKHPRHPAGESDGGEFAPGDGGSDSLIVPAAGPPPPWHNNPPERIGDPPKIPKTEPTTDAAKFLAIRTVVYWLGNALKFGLTFTAQIKALITAAQTATWLWPYVRAYLQGPKTLEELQADVKSPGVGYDIHHIVEQSAAKNGIPRSLIDSPRNLIRIPKIKHWELNAWFDRKNSDYGNMTPRQYMNGKSWYVRRAVGLDGLRKVGVLK